MTNMRTGHFFVDGEWVEPLGRATLDIINPATEGVIGTLAMGSAEDADRAVRAARAAFPVFSQSSVADRLALMERIAEIYARRFEDLAHAMTAEMGAPIAMSRSDQAQSGLDHLRLTMAALKEFAFETSHGPTTIVREPIGVAALITPWNWPMNQIMCKVAPALATGCTMVLKPSELAPLSALILAEIMEEAGTPKGVFNLVMGDGPTVGVALSGHPGVDMVSVTGSNRAGVSVAETAAASIKRVVQELGGKSANILLDDVDLEAAVTSGAEFCFFNTGQSCDAPTRMLVPAALHDRAVEIACAVAAKTTVGDPTSEDVALGPLSNRNQFAKVTGLIETGIAEGATLACGGAGRPDGLERGWFVKPTIFAQVSPSMAIAQEEIFGPVLCIMPYESEDQAVEIANASRYGLAAYVQAGDHERARSVARRLRAGQVHINYPDFDMTAPFGGYKQSGNGREYADWGMADFLETKALLGDVLTRA
ncbi:MAG: aldehyde dehydrogenase family protein [Pseudomonadota bacterium]